MATKKSGAGDWQDHEVPEVERSNRPTHNFNDDPTVTGIVKSFKRQNVRDPEGGGKKEKLLVIAEVDGEETNIWLPMPDTYHKIFAKLRGHEVQVTREGDSSDPSAVRYRVRSRKVGK